MGMAACRWMANGRLQMRCRHTGMAIPPARGRAHVGALACAPKTLCCIGSHSFYMCKYTSVLSMLGACFARLAQQNHVYGKVSVEYLHV